MQSGKRVVVDVDLEKFFDRVNHDILIEVMALLEGMYAKLHLQVNQAKSAVTSVFGVPSFWATAYGWPRVQRSSSGWQISPWLRSSSASGN